MAKFVEVTLDKPRRLRFGTNAICALEENLGRTFDIIMGPNAQMGMRELRAILWAGLLHDKGENGKPLSIEEIGDILDDMMDDKEALNAVGRQVGEALALAQGMDPAGKNS